MEGGTRVEGVRVGGLPVGAHVERHTGGYVRVNGRREAPAVNKKCFAVNYQRKRAKIILGRHTQKVITLVGRFARGAARQRWRLASHPSRHCDWARGVLALVDALGLGAALALLRSHASSAPAHSRPRTQHLHSFSSCLVSLGLLPHCVCVCPLLGRHFLHRTRSTRQLRSDPSAALLR
jgi:hypothetical protein